MGFGIGPIPFTAIAEYFRIYELSNFDEFVYLIRRMDSVFLELRAEEETSKNSGGPKKNGSKHAGQKHSNQGGRTRR